MARRYDASAKRNRLSIVLFVDGGTRVEAPSRLRRIRKLIEPLVCEDEWLVILKNSDAWAPPGKTTVVISPHPDDETLGAGGLIARQALRGVATCVIAVTDGEAAYSYADGLARARRLEQDQAVEVLGLKCPIIRLGLPDSAVSKHEPELRRLLTPIITSDTLVLAPWSKDWHPDHEACARVAAGVCESVGAALFSYVFWTWHRRTADVFDEVKTLRFELDLVLQGAKQKALECYRSQLHHKSGEPILPNLLLAPAYRSFETFISHV